MFCAKGLVSKKIREYYVFDIEKSIKKIEFIDTILFYAQAGIYLQKHKMKRENYMFTN